MFVTLEHKTLLSRTTIFVAVANKTLSQNYPFLFYAKNH